MSVNNFIPQLWHAALLENLNDRHVYADCVNREYEGEIKSHGDTVRINSIGRVTVSAYTKNTWNLTPEVLDGAGQTLTITEQDYFYFGLDDVDKAQIKGAVMSAAMKEAAWALADDADVFLATTIAAGVPTGTTNTMTAATVGSGAGEADAFEILIDLGVLLDVQNTPAGGRWAVVPPWYIGELLKDPRFTSFGTAENVARAMNGTIKTMSGFDLKVSNNVPVSGSAYTILAGYKGAATYANSIAEGSPESFRHPDGFVDVVRGLHVYGAKVTRPSNLVAIAATKGSGS
ncbi:MAG: hypothetical protein NUW01_03620 [Gemmatimonadaceae bacterium]|nr:hypothetical protein [Gemmatimonadaceae bacterium]